MRDHVRVITNEPGLLRVEVGPSVEALSTALAGVTDLLITQGHPEFGIEITLSVGDEYLTLSNQPDPLTAILNARRRFDAGERA